METSAEGCSSVEIRQLLYNARLIRQSAASKALDDDDPMPDGIKDALLIYNPTSGRRRKHRFEEIEQAVRILKDAGINLRARPDDGARRPPRAMARHAVEQRRGMVIACGGDGTINEVVNGLAGSQVPMALLPAGTANILAKELGIPWDIPHAARLIPGGIVRRIALGLASAGNENGRGSDACRGGIFFASEARGRTGRSSTAWMKFSKRTRGFSRTGWKG